ncbi:unnamed protein product [Mytilus coruscus]|uniref:Ig-like domain-containing protein n=1 Tax=Mytilus coruscus TaxID=42192 RepID=A0A6J8CEA6_MYTCO|nr:unnamed protein product [Mytilus coruscus]
MHVCKVLFVALLFSFDHFKRESSVLDRISWNLHTMPAVFKKDVQLECHISTKFNCCNDFTRKWSRGKSYDLIVMNGVSLDTAKYKEYLNISANTSTLTIYEFSEYDIDIPYECSYGFISDSKILELTEENFEYHPEEMLPYNLTSEGQQVVLNITLMKVYPAPICTAMDGIKDVTNNLFIKNDENGLFLRSNIRFNYTINYVCHATIEILCRIGQTKFAIVNGSRPCIKEKSGFTLSLIEIVIVAIYSIMVIISITIWISLLVKYLLSDNNNVHKSTNTDDNTIDSEIDRNNDGTIDIQQHESVETQEGLNMEPIVQTQVVQDVQQSQPLLQSNVNALKIETIEHVEVPKKPKTKPIKNKKQTKQSA